MANFLKAFELDLTMIPVVNKIDLPSADVPRVCREMYGAFDFPPEEIVRVSAKNGVGVEEVLCAVVDRVPAPSGDEGSPLRALLFDSWYDRHRGVISLVRMMDGRMQAGDRVRMSATENAYTVQTVGLLHPEQTPTKVLRAGHVGYVVLGMKDRAEALVGDTLTGAEEAECVQPLPGFLPQKPMVFAGIFPEDSGELNSLNVAIQKLTLSDPSVTVRRDSNGPLGAGFHCGFLGLLHMDVFMQRLEQEHGASLIATAPTVPYHVWMRDGSEREVDNAADFPSPADFTQCTEPWVECKVVSPTRYVQSIAQMVMDRRGYQVDQESLDDHDGDLVHSTSAQGARSVVTYAMPLGEVVVDFYDHLKQLTAGYASLDYEETGYEPADLVKLEIHVNQEVVPPLSLVVHREKAVAHGRKLVNKLKEVIKRDLFQIQIQAVIGGKVIASQRLTALRKDVTAKCYGMVWRDRERERRERERREREREREGRESCVCTCSYVCM
jgi:elongation factor 4